MSVYVKMTALADEARTLSGKTYKKSIDEIIEDVTDANEEITDQSALISQILDAVNNLPEAKGDNLIDITDITRGESDVSVDEGQVNVPGGYYPSRVVKEIPRVQQATPAITVFSTGQIIAKATQAEGYVYGGTKQKTTQLTTQAGKEVTPSASSQTAVASGVFTTGAVTVKGDGNLKAENIKKDVTIFGVKGTFEGSGGGGASVETCTVTLITYSPISGSSLIVHYVDGTQSYKQETFPNSMMDDPKTITVQKNSILATPLGIAEPNADGIITSSNRESARVYFVTNDMTLYSM